MRRDSLFEWHQFVRNSLAHTVTHMGEPKRGPEPLVVHARFFLGGAIALGARYNGGLFCRVHQGAGRLLGRLAEAGRAAVADCAEGLLEGCATVLHVARKVFGVVHLLIWRRGVGNRE